MYWKRSNVLASFLAAIAMSGTPACSSNDAGEQAADAVQQSASDLEATSREQEPVPPDVTLATVRLSATHSVQFTESPEGDLEVREQLNADTDRVKGRRNIVDLEDRSLSLTEIHRYLLPDAPVPEALLTADTRAKQRVVEPPRTGPEEDVFSREDTESATVGEEQARAENGSSFYWDWAADAQWFYQYYHVGGSGGRFAANKTWIHFTKDYYTNWYKASAFNQSFDSGARFRVARSRKCGFMNWGTCWNTKLNEDVPNRMITTYLGSGPRYRRAWLDGYGPNPRVALSVRWTLVNNDPGPAPSACGGHNQWACSTNPRCQSNYVNYNNACFGCGTRGQACCKDWGPVPTNGGAFGVCFEGSCDTLGGYCQ